jgi:uncharacterized protein
VSNRFLDIAATPSVRAAQAANGAGGLWEPFEGERSSHVFTEKEKSFIAARDSFYMASVSETGWPYIQHRGGPAGFMRVLDGKTFAFADYRGNRQYISVGNLAADDRVALILVDYPHRQRLKIYAHAEIRDLKGDQAFAEAVATPGYRAKIERAFLFHLEAFDWNCPQHITPRFTQVEVQAALAPTLGRLNELEAENRMLRDRIAAGTVGADPQPDGVHR